MRCGCRAQRKLQTSASAPCKNPTNPTREIYNPYSSVHTPLLSGKTFGTNPEARKGLQVVLVSAGYGVLFSSLDSEHVFSSAPRLNFFNEGAIHKHRAMNPDESIRFELFRDRGDGLAKEIRARLSLQQHVVALGLYNQHVLRIDE